MNGQNFKNAFGKAPDSFKYRVAFALDNVEEKKVKKFSIRLILIAGIILVLMAGVVYAASTEWKVLDFVTAWYSKAPTANLEKAMKENDIRQTFDAGEFLIKLEEAVADGKYMYISANVSIKNGENAYLLPMNISSTKRICEVVGPRLYIMRSSKTYPLNWQDEQISEIFTETHSVSNDARSFRTAAKQEGKRLIGASMWVKHGNDYNEMTCFTVLPDGSVSFVLGSSTATEERTLDVELYLSAGEVDNAGVYSKKNEYKIIPLTLPVLPATEVKTVDVGNAPIEGVDVKVNRIEFCLTPITLHYRLYYSAPSDFQKKNGQVFYLNFLNEKGKLILPGLSIMTHFEYLGNNEFVQIGSLLLDSIPQSFSIQGHSIIPQIKYGKITLSLH